MQLAPEIVLTDNRLGRIFSKTVSTLDLASSVPWGRTEKGLLIVASEVDLAVSVATMGCGDR